MEPESEVNVVNEAFLDAVGATCNQLLTKAYNAVVVDLECLKKSIKDGPESNLTKKSATTFVQSLLDKAIELCQPDSPALSDMSDTDTCKIQIREYKSI